jgi:hypothetical protein
MRAMTTESAPDYDCLTAMSLSSSECIGRSTFQYLASEGEALVYGVRSHKVLAFGKGPFTHTRQRF